MDSDLVLLALLFYFAVIVVTVLLLRRFGQRENGAVSAKTTPPPAESGGVTKTTQFLKRQVEDLEQRDIQRKLYMELIRLLSKATTFGDLAKGCVDALCVHLGASHGGLLWKGGAGRLVFKYGKGYGALDGFELPLHASIAGTSLLRKEPVFVKEPKDNIQYVAIPGVHESNVLCAPLEMFGDLRGVLRIANIDVGKVKPSELVSTFTSLTPLVAAALERALISQENQRRKTQLAAISGITQTINRTLELKEICAACARHLLPVFGYNHLTMVRYVKEDDVSTIIALPRELRFTESAATSRIMLRNLCAPKQPLLIEDLQRTDKVDCHNKALHSLIVVPLYVGGKPFASVVLTSPPERTYDTDDMNVLATLAEHISVTLERAVHFKRQEDLATRDGLTGLYNHRVFQEHLKAELDRLIRYKRAFSLVLLDIDHFKKFNDTYGHQTGDVVLRAVAQSLRSSCRATDTVFRYGGEEFCAILPETRLRDAALFARRLNAAVRNRTVATQHGNLRVTISVGVAQAGGESGAADAIVEAADKAMYHAKQTGRDRVSLYQGGRTIDGNS